MNFYSCECRSLQTGIWFEAATFRCYQNAHWHLRQRAVRKADGVDEVPSRDRARRGDDSRIAVGQGGCDSGGTKCCCIFLHQVEIRSLRMLPRTVKNFYALHRRYNLKYINKCQNNFGSWNVCLAVMVSVYHLWVSWYFACKVLKHDFCSKWRYTLRIGKAVLSVNVAFLFFI